MRCADFPSEPVAAARVYLARGYAPIPVPPRSKIPVESGWQNLRLSADQLDGRIGNGNVGLLMGEASGHLVVVDNDCHEAAAAVRFILPMTRMRGGRDGRDLHWFYRSPKTKSQQWEDPCHEGGATPSRPHGALLLELLAGGRQCLVAPSVHPDGPQYRWAEFGEPQAIDAEGASADPLTEACAVLAATSLLIRYWPATGKRDKAFMALAGGLLRSRCWVAVQMAAVSAFWSWSDKRQQHEPMDSARLVFVPESDVNA